MQILSCEKPGIFQYQESNIPVIKPGQSLLKIKRIGICGTDLHAFEGNQPFFEYPRVLGHELAAEYITGDAPGFEAGEVVTIIPYFYCGECIACRNDKPNCCVRIKVCGVHQDGGMAEYLAVPSYSLIHSEGLTLDELALIEPLAIGVHGISRAAVKKEEFVLIMGAGPIGLALMEFAQIAGARVIVMDINDQRLSFCKDKLKTSFLINPARQDALSELKKITNNHLPQVVIDATGNRAAIHAGFDYLAHGGRYVLVGLQKGDISFPHPDFHRKEATLMSSRNATADDFKKVMESIKKGQINPGAYITHRIPFNKVKDEFPNLLVPANGVVKAMVTFD
jgi:2-desacetyl-2-hydroxyethyl bacteriochlorophyllide A dehydrogenase